MNPAAKYVIAALLIAIATHFAIVHAMPRVLMDAAFARVSDNGGHVNTWRHSPRITEASRTIALPSPDLHYAVCPYNLSHGPVRIHVDTWPAYWSLSLYAANSDNFFVLDDREAHDGAEITLIRAGHAPPDHAGRIVESPSQRGIALVRRLAPSAAEFDAATEASRGDVCAPAP